MFFRRCVFNEVLIRFQWKNHVHWWSPRAQNSGNSCAKVRILDFLVFSIVGNLEKTVKIMKCLSPFNVTHKSKTVIFIKFRRSALGNQVFQTSLWSLYIQHFGGFQGRSHEAPSLIGKVSPSTVPAVLGPPNRYCKQYLRL